jgi:hypothetical protein
MVPSPPHRTSAPHALSAPHIPFLSFVEDEASNEGPNYNAWSEIEVRARATEVVASGVLYAAHALLHRGYAYEAGQGTAWIVGANSAVSRFVETPVLRAEIAHLVSGYRDDVGSRSTMLLGSVPLYYFNDEAPAWWTNAADTSYRSYANNTSPSTNAGLGFWGDVCASFCVRVYDDDSEFMELDFTVRTATGQWGRCSCYAYQDTDTHSTHANKTSHVAPDDVRVRSLESKPCTFYIPDGGRARRARRHWSFCTTSTRSPTTSPTRRTCLR